ncbi:hypothetical protein BDW42DRAFT_65871 [Aspergillus taichungensis]|uniref:Uncharacterized protein n=1 Tax=Aspergillus taichungensis TaxID=482145 RepID=A0A2J5I116_9EURO|nr:hypothetical protein BDW42DRAFT_65871 [Aspergillus taichungensis]
MPKTTPAGDPLQSGFALCPFSLFFFWTARRVGPKDRVARLHTCFPSGTHYSLSTLARQGPKTDRTSGVCAATAVNLAQKRACRRVFQAKSNHHVETTPSIINSIPPHCLIPFPDLIESPTERHVDVYFFLLFRFVPPFSQPTVQSVDNDDFHPYFLLLSGLTQPEHRPTGLKGKCSE